MHTSSARYSPGTWGLCSTILLLILFFTIAPNAHAQHNSVSGCDNDPGLTVVDSDKFEVIYINGCWLEYIWHDGGTGKDNNLSIWQPDIGQIERSGYSWDEWFYPGPLLTNEPNLTGDASKYVTFLFKPKKPEYAKRATGVKEVWKDNGSGADKDLGVWELECPSGYVALGLQAVSHHNKTGIPKMGCVQENLTYELDIYKPKKDKNDSIWAIDADDKIAFYGVTYTPGKNQPKNHVILPPPTFWAKKDSFDPPSRSKFRGLMLPIEPIPLHPKASLKKPELTEPSVAGFESETYPKKHSVSALVVSDDHYNSDLARLQGSPKYLVITTTEWKPVDGGFPCEWNSPDNCEYTYTINQGESETTTWNNTIGVALSQSVTADASFKPLGLGVGLEVTLGLEESYSHEFGGDESTSTEKGTSRMFPVAPGTYAAAFEGQTTIEVYRHNEKSPGNLISSRQTSPQPQNALVAVVTVPLAKENAVLGCDDKENRDLEVCGLPAYSSAGLPENKMIKSESGNHYLILSKGSLEVRDNKTGISQHKHTWSLDEIHHLGTLHSPIDHVTFESGRLCAYERGASAPGWCSTEEGQIAEFGLDPNAATLELDPEGSLRIMIDGMPIWTSAADE